MNTRMVAVPGGSLFTTTEGAATALTAVLVHAGLAHSAMWHGLMAATRGELRTVAYDCRCFGRSRTSSQGTYSDVADLGSVLDAYGLERTVLVAASRGARIAVDFTLTHPERVRGLFLAAPDISGFDGPVTAAEQTLMDAMASADEAGDVEGVIAAEGRLFVDGPDRGEDPCRAGLRREVAEMSRVNYAQQHEPPEFTSVEPPAAGRLAELACPVHVLVGTADTSGMRAMADAVATTSPRATLVEVSDAAHLLVQERSAVVERELRSWLRTL